ncbi:MAG: hypothetical protein ACP5UR_08015 [Chloroflexus sp.]|uniref:hypothetical protein n=1 Tax=Chloroflexus sp. TaxID=1904827 RepID=UPI003D13762F
MYRWLHILALLLMCCISPVFAQGRIIINDPLQQLRQPSVIQTAAEPLIQEGAIVVVYVKARGDDADFFQLLKRDGFIRSDGKERVELIAIYVAIADNYSALRFGEQWYSQLYDRYQQILNDHLRNPLSSPDLSRDIAGALTAVRQPTTVVQQPTTDIGWESFIPILGFIPIALVVITVIAIVVVASQFIIIFQQLLGQRHLIAKATLDSLNQRFIEVLERLCAQAGNQRDPACRLLFQDVYLGLLRLKRGNAGSWQSAYSPEEELSRVEQQLKDLERVAVTPVSSLIIPQTYSPAAWLPTVSDDSQVSAFRTALSGAVQEWWRLEWELADQPTVARYVDPSRLREQLVTLLWLVSNTTKIPAALAEAQAIVTEIEQMRKTLRWHMRYQYSKQRTSTGKRRYTNIHEYKYEYEYTSTASLSDNSGWGDLFGGSDSSDSSDSGGSSDSGSSSE